VKNLISSESMKRWIKRLFAVVGIEVRWKRPDSDQSGPRASMRDILLQAKRVGFVPETVIDVGAAFGSFSRECHDVFSNARYLLLEPLEEYRPLLERLTQAMPTAQYMLAAAAARSGEIEINVHPDLVGSSLYREVEKGTDVNGVARAVSATTIDSAVNDCGARGPFLLKVDVQGAELDVLHGAEKSLADCEYVILEVSFFKFFQGGPECVDVVAYMKERGFVPYDIIGLQYRPLDRALSQADIAFVKENGLFRRQHFYATRTQRTEQNAQMKSQMAQLFRHDSHA